MKIPFLKPAIAASLTGLVLAGCGAPNLAVTASPIDISGKDLPTKKAEISDQQMKSWSKTDLINDTIPGMSVAKAYNKIIKPSDVKGETVIVAVLDSGVDDEHEDLNDIIWVNKDEIPNNGVDDDNNGYVDDIHGWNFLGDIVGANLNFTRIVRQYKPKFEGKSESEISPENMEEYKLYKRAKSTWEKKHAQALKRKQRIKKIITTVKTADDKAKEEFGADYTLEDVKSMKTETPESKRQKLILSSILSRSDKGISAVLDQMDKGLEYFNDKLKYYLNLDFKAREIIGDDYHDFSARGYGDNDVDGPEKSEEHVMHGTHVAGIIAAERNNGIGIKGVANNVKIMVIRAVPNGDEYDKDIALGIRYAVDNGADIINGSFGKSFSSHPEWVVDAIKYAAENDVLIVHAAGNDATDVDTERFFPNDQWPGHEKEVAENVLTIGAINAHYGKDMVASFSNYGATNVDVFAPGVDIYSTVPHDKYKMLSGTSMASPEVAGVAAVIRSYYPELSASQVKQIIMESGIPIDIKVKVPGKDTLQEFSELSISGKIANLYNALILADQIAN